MNWIYKANRWYDDLDHSHPFWRFLIFIVPMGIAYWCLFSHSFQVRAIAGVTIISAAIFRCIPNFWPRKRNGR